MKNLYYYDTILGVIGICDNRKEIIEVFFGKIKKDGFSIIETSLIKETYK